MAGSSERSQERPEAAFITLWLVPAAFAICFLLAVAGGLEPQPSLILAGCGTAIVFGCWVWTRLRAMRT